jgi:hypothetical protein
MTIQLPSALVIVDRRRSEAPAADGGMRHMSSGLEHNGHQRPGTSGLTSAPRRLPRGWGRAARADVEEVAERWMPG